MSHQNNQGGDAVLPLRPGPDPDPQSCGCWCLSVRARPLPLGTLPFRRARPQEPPCMPSRPVQSGEERGEGGG